MVRDKISNAINPVQAQRHADCIASANGQSRSSSTAPGGAIGALYSALVAYWTSAGTREQIVAAEAAWTDEQLQRAADLIPRSGTHDERADERLDRATRAWLALGMDDFDEAVEDALELFERRRRLGAYR